jgi:hypothetical protein
VKLVLDSGSKTIVYSFIKLDKNSEMVAKYEKFAEKKTLAKRSNHPLCQKTSLKFCDTRGFLTQ